jgi:hypothetical protein
MRAVAPHGATMPALLTASTSCHVGKASPRHVRRNGGQANPPRTEKAVHAIKTLAATGRKRDYEYTEEEAQACFSAIEDAARELFEAFELGGDTQAPEPRVEEPLSTLDPERRRVTIVRSKIDRARSYIREGKIEDALKALNAAIREAPEESTLS